ncbi:uncharacterized protein ISCGN_016500 [Ixodes scapularis]
MAYKPCFFVPQVLLPLLAYCASRYNGFAFDFITMDSLPQVPVGDSRRHDDVKQATWIYDSPRFIKENPSTSTTPAAPDVKSWQFSEFSSGHGSSATAAMAYKPCFFVPQVLLPLLAYCASRYNGFAFDFITMDSLPQVPVGDSRRHDDVKQATWIYDSPRFIKENPSTSTTPAAPDVKSWQFSEFSSGHGSSATAAMAYKPCFFVPQATSCASSTDAAIVERHLLARQEDDATIVPRHLLARYFGQIYPSEGRDNDSTSDIAPKLRTLQVL